MRSAGNFNSEWGYLAPAPSFMRTARVVLVATAIGATAGAAVVLSLLDRPAAEAGKTASLAAHAIVTSVHAATAATTPPPGAVAASLAAPAQITNQVTNQVATKDTTKDTIHIATPAAQAALPTTAMSSPAPAVQPAAPQVAAQPSPVIATPGQSAAIAVPQPPARVAPIVEGNNASDAIAAPMAKPAQGMAALAETPPASDVIPDAAMIPPQTVPPERKARHSTARSYASNDKDKPAPANLGTLLRRLFTSHANGQSYYPDR